MATLIIEFVPKTPAVRQVRLMKGLHHIHITINGRAMCRRKTLFWHALKPTRKSVATCPGCIVQATNFVREGGQ